MEIVRDPNKLKADCPKCKDGIMFRVDLSRLEEGLGHEGFKCDRCGHQRKYVPRRAS